MASTNKTTKLGLSLWEETDKPERADFVKDNEIIENKLGTHLANSLTHLTDAEKFFLWKPFSVTSYVGDGAARRTFDFEFKKPVFMIIFTRAMPPVLMNNGIPDLYFAMGGDQRNSAGLQCEREFFSVLNQDTGTTYRARLNEQGRTYFVVTFPAIP